MKKIKIIKYPKGFPLSYKVKWNLIMNFKMCYKLWTWYKYKIKNRKKITYWDININTGGCF